MGWGHLGSPAQSPWCGRPCWSPPTCAGHGPTAPGRLLSITTCGTQPPPARRSKEICFPPMPREAPCVCVTGWRHWWHWEEARSRVPPSPVTAAPLGSGSPLRGVQGAPRAGRQPGLLLSQPEQPLPHTRPRHKDALLFLRRAKTEPGQSHPFGSGAVPGGHRGPLGGNLENWGCPRAAHQLPDAGSPSPLDVPRGSHGVAVPRVSRACREGEAPAAPRAPEAPGWESPGGAGGRGAAGPGFVLAAPQHPPRRSSPSGQEEQSCSAHAGHGPSHSPTCPGPRLVMLGWILRWEKHPDPPQTPVGCRKKGAEPHGSRP